MSVYDFRHRAQKRDLRNMRLELLRDYPDKLEAKREALARAYCNGAEQQHLWSRIARDLDKETGFVRHDLHLTGVKQHVARMDDWRDREVTPKWLDWLIVGGALTIIVIAAVVK